jgi:hypothetical protein
MKIENWIHVQKVCKIDYEPDMVIESYWLHAIENDDKMHQQLYETITHTLTEVLDYSYLKKTVIKLNAKYNDCCILYDRLKSTYIDFPEYYTHAWDL